MLQERRDWCVRGYQGVYVVRAVASQRGSDLWSAARLLSSVSAHLPILSAVEWPYTTTFRRIHHPQEQRAHRSNSPATDTKSSPLEWFRTICQVPENQVVKVSTGACIPQDIAIEHIAGSTIETSGGRDKQPRRVRT